MKTSARSLSSDKPQPSGPPQISGADVELCLCAVRSLDYALCCAAQPTRRSENKWKPQIPRKGLSLEGEKSFSLSSHITSSAGAQSGVHDAGGLLIYYELKEHRKHEDHRGWRLKYRTQVNWGGPIRVGDKDRTSGASLRPFKIKQEATETKAMTKKKKCALLI